MNLTNIVTWTFALSFCVLFWFTVVAWVMS